MSWRLLNEIISEIEIEHDPGDRWWDFQEKLSVLLTQYPELESKLSATTKQQWDEGIVSASVVLAEIERAIFSDREPDDFLPGKGN